MGDSGGRSCGNNDELEKKRSQEVVRELPEYFRAFVPATLLVVDKEIFFEETQVITTRLISRTWWMEVRAPELE